MLSAFTDNIFLQMALWASLLASIASGVIGTLVVVKRIAFLAGSISHAILGGMGFCLWAQRTYDLPWLDPIWGAFASSIGSALLIGWIHLNYRQREDAVIAAIWSTGMAIGLIFLSLTPGTNVDLLN
jgi:zinc transport system permease protein